MGPWSLSKVDARGGGETERERERERRGCGLRLSLRERGIKKFLSGRRFITYSCVRATGTLCEGWQLAQRGSSFYSPRSRPQIPQTSRDKLCSFLRLSVSLSLSLSLLSFFTDQWFLWFVFQLRIREKLSWWRIERINNKRKNGGRW